LLDRVITPSPAQKGDLQIGVVKRDGEDKEEGGVEEGGKGEMRRSEMEWEAL